MITQCGTKITAYRNGNEERAVITMSHTVQTACYPNIDYSNCNIVNLPITKSSFVAQIIDNIKKAMSHQNRREDYVERIK